jgi:hypothetical protein
MFEAWFLTVPSPILSALAISRLLMPLVMSFSTSVSRSVKSCGAPYWIDADPVDDAANFREQRTCHPSRAPDVFGGLAAGETAGDIEMNR